MYAARFNLLDSDWLHDSVRVRVSCVFFLRKTTSLFRSTFFHGLLVFVVF